MMDEADRGRFVALIGDAELDEGNIYEALIEGDKHDVRNLWWIVDYNRQSLDATSADRMFERFDEIFRSCGWRVVELRYGKRLRAALTTHPKLKSWFERLPNADLSALHYQGGAAWRARIEARSRQERSGIPQGPRRCGSRGPVHRSRRPLHGIAGRGVRRGAGRRADPVHRLDDQGHGLPFAGHKDNHAGLMNPTQMAAWREAMGVAEGREWEPLESVGDNARPGVEALIERSRIAREKRGRAFGQVDVPAIPVPAGEEQITQAAFGRILLEIAKAGGELADRIVTTSPDVTVSTNLGAWVNQRGLFRRERNGGRFCEGKRLHLRKSGRRPTKASTSSSASPRTTCS